MLANAFNDLGEISRATGSYEEARKYYEESLAIRQKINNPNDIAICLNNLGSIAHTQGDYEGARGYAEVSLRLFLESGNKRAAPYPLSVLGRIARDEADFIASFAAFRRALQICYEINYVPKSIDILFELATVLEAMKRPEAAVRLLAFVITHPKINHETRKAAEALHSELAENLAVETAVELVRQGQQDTLEHVLRTVLSRELERPE
jgi:tetratricopeptide (TPR) repeat protein